ncbi:MAG: hypothetical protein AAFQ14_02765 [Cyanobacteria bacterium J06621_12]
MPDYDFKGLSPRLFEQLIQAIALQVVSPKTIIFGDGTDGGREATFQGKTNYNSDDEPWDGYIVFQAKFCQRPTNDTKKDGDWAIAQLKKELDDFADPDKRRKKPEYYIFITNVVLTPVLEKGSKDRAYRVFEEYQDTVAIKDYDIWDYDKLCRFIDANEDIRRTYAAWITSGDVLSQVVEMLSFNRPDFKTVISSFLKKELQSDLYANLEQAGHSGEDKIPLASVFVDLPVTGRQTGEAARNESETNIVALLVEDARRKLDYDSLSLDRDRNAYVAGLPVFTQPQKVGKWVVIGGPGQGKTTVGQFLCQLFRAAILKDVENLRDWEVQQALAKFESQCNQENICFPVARRFPFRIILNELAAVLASNDSINSLLDYIAWKIHKRTSTKIDVEDIRQWLANYPWLIILDGLDEVPASSNRQQVLTAIKDFGVDANQVNADIMIVATTRPQGYNEDFDTDFYGHIWLAPLSKKQALHYARRLLEIRYENDSDRQSKIRSRLERAAKDNFTVRLMQSPLQVTIMTVLLNKTGQAPKDRWSLFNKYYDIIYDREVERDIPASEILRDYKSDIDSIHFQVGLLLQVQSEHSGKTDARLSVEDFTTLVRSRLEAEGHEGKECTALTRQIIEAAANRLVFLVGLEQDIVGFEVRSLQEFMASEAIMNGSDNQISNRLKEIIPIISWRNVALFAIGKCFARNEKEHLRSFIHTECAALNDLDDFNSACLSGSRLALDILEDGSVAHKPKFLKLFARLALRLLDLSDLNFSIQLENVFTDNLEAIYKEEIETRISNQNYQKHLQSWLCLLLLINSDYDWAIELISEYWQDRELKIEVIEKFLMSLFTVDNQWIAREIEEVIASTSPLKTNFLLPRFGNIQKILDSRPKSWLEPVVNLFDDSIARGKESSLVEVELSLDSNPQSEKISLYYCQPEHLLNFGFPDLNDVAGLNKDWKIYSATKIFLNSPCKETLAQSLTMIAENYNRELIKLIARRQLPWQISECLLATENYDELLAIVKNVRSGKLGDIEQWKQAEARWNTVGLNKKDFLNLNDQQLLVDENIAEVGFPFNSAMWRFPSSDISLISVLESWYSQCENLYLRKIINISASQLMIRINKNTIKSDVEYQIHSLSRIKSIIKNEYDLYYWDCRELKTIASYYHESEQTELINYMGLKAKGFSSFSSESNTWLLKRLIKWINNDYSLQGILRIISYILTFEDEELELLSELREDILNLDYSEDLQDQESIMIIKIYKQEITEDIIDRAINLQKSSPRILNTITSLIERDKVDGAAKERILKQLLSGLQKIEYNQHASINGLINEQLATRKSELSNRNKWSQLGLPSGASILLPE